MIGPRRPAATPADGGRSVPQGSSDASTDEQLAVTFVCPRCGANADRVLTPSVRPEPFACPARPCRHLFSPPEDFWDHAFAVLRPTASTNRRAIRRPLPVAGENVLRVAAAAAAAASRHRRPRGLSPVHAAPFILRFEWPVGSPVGALPSHTLEAETLEQAKLQAAIRYAGASFQAVPPNAYRILGPTGDTLYRHPAPRTGG